MRGRLLSRDKMAAHRMLMAVRRAFISPRFLLRPGCVVGSRKASTISKDQRIPTPNEDFSSFKDPGYAEDGYTLGDYPNLPEISAQRRGHFGWWDMQDRRNYNEPVHENEDALNVWLWSDVECNDKYTRWQVLSHFLVAFGLLGLVGFASYLYDAPSRNPAVPRQLPFNNLYLEVGGDPDKDPSESTHKVPNTALGS